MSGPPELGGLDADEQRQVAEALAGGSPDAWFVWFQHGPVVRMLVRSENEVLRDRHLPDLCAGRALGGVAYSHLRTPRPSVFAERVDGGWRLTGTQPWCTGWPLVDLVLAGALDRDGDAVVFGLVPAGDRPALRSTGELRLAAMAGTRTHALAFDGLLVPDGQVVAVRDRAEFAAYDTALNANVQPSTYGVALAALDLLEERQPDGGGRAAGAGARLPGSARTGCSTRCPATSGSTSASRCGPGRCCWRWSAARRCSRPVAGRAWTSPTRRSGCCGRRRSSSCTARPPTCARPPWTRSSRELTA